VIRAFIGLNNLAKEFNLSQGVLEMTLRTPVCISGCGRCCTTPTCMIIEALNMVSVLTGFDALKKAVDAAEHWLLDRPPVAAHEIALSYKGLPVGIVSQALRQEQAQVANGACPFLTDEKRCLIHQARPLYCMALGVTREAIPLHSGKPGCPRPLGHGESLTRRGTVESGHLRQMVQEFKDDCERKPEWKIYGFAPTLLFRAAKPDIFRAYVDDNRIPSAKIIGTAFDTNLMWQPDLDAQRQDDLVTYSTKQILLGKN
jgi:Fe-S-cluster containining protein